MKRFVVFISLFALLTLSGAWLANAAAVSVKNSKHNLQYKAVPESGNGTIKASVDKDMGGTSEICVFCHTPHSGNTQAPLWNKTPSVGSYSTYTSDVLAGLGYWPAEDPKNGVPHAKTRICLSCHDGTIALGSLVNMPYGAATQIPMEGTTGGNMPTTSAGYIGVELQDDHPVAIQFDTGPDPELQSIPIGSKVKLYTATGKDYVECTSCHDPHDNQWGNFLVDSNQNSALCYECHSKGGFSGSVHDDNTINVAYAPPTEAPAAGGNPTNHGPNVGHVKCISCHFVHKAGITGLLTTSPPTASPNPGSGKYLLSFQEEKTCFNNTDRWGQQVVQACHGSSASAPKRNIESVETAALSGKRHWTQDAGTVGRHEATEARTAGWIHIDGDQNKWHVECADCHNPHTAGPSSHTANPPQPVWPGLPTLANTSPLFGAGGVNVSSAVPWGGGVGSYSYLEPTGVLTGVNPSVSYEFQICFKCHSDFAWNNGTVPTSPSFAPPAPMTDQATEFMNSASFHPVTKVTGRNVGTLVGNWNQPANKGAQTMYCSDCHNNSAAPPQGPHGSGENFILVAKFTDMYSARGGGDAQKQPNGDLCFVCHNQNTYSQTSNLLNGGTNFTATPGGLNLHAMHAYRVVNPTIGGLNPWPYRCVNCHARVPHGFNKLAMIVQTSTDAAPYVADGTPLGLGGGKISNFVINSQNYVIGNCTTANGCHVAGP